MVVPARRVKTEYMKRFKEPKWESCGACYLELLHYRLSRRLLEQAHRPWLWDGWEQDSGSGGGSTAGSPSPPGAGSPPGPRDEQEEAAAPGEAGRASPGRSGGGGEGGTRVSGALSPSPGPALPCPSPRDRHGWLCPSPARPGAHPRSRGRRGPGPPYPPPGHGPGLEGPISSRVPAGPAGKPWLRHPRCLFKEPSGGNSHPESQPLM